MTPADAAPFVAFWICVAAVAMTWLILHYRSKP
jgi:hypothetical protein